MSSRLSLPFGLAYRGLLPWAWTLILFGGACTKKGSTEPVSHATNQGSIETKDTRIAIAVKPIAADPPQFNRAMVPYHDDPGAPPIAGDPQGLDLERLARSRTTFTLSTDRPVLGALGQVDPNFLRANLEADPRWRVGLDASGQALACPRERAGASWVTPAHGYLSQSGRPQRWRYCVRFGPRPVDHPWSNSPLVAHNPPESLALKVAAVRLDQGAWAGWQGAALTIDGPQVSVELHEASPHLDMHATATALAELQARIENLVGVANRENPQRAALSGLPAGEPVMGQLGLRCEAAGEQIHVLGRLRVESQGWTWIRPLDSQGQPTPHAAAVQRQSAERIGLAPSPESGMSLESRLSRNSLAGAARIEAWHQPDAGGPPIAVGAWPLECPSP